MTVAQQALCIDNLRLVGYCAKKFLPSGIDWEELCACGNLGLAKVASMFSPERGARFSTYAGRCIDNEIRMLLRQRRKHSKVGSLDEEISSAEGIQLHDVLPADSDMEEAAEHKILAADALAKVRALPAKKRRVWEMHFGLAGEPPMNQREIAERLGCSRALISRILNESI